MKPVRFHPEAETEMIEAAAYYESRQQALGRRFLTTVQDAINRIRVSPLLYAVVEDDVRRCLVRTFPYGVLFRVQPEEIVIVAVMHLHRDPDYWQDRARAGR